MLQQAEDFRAESQVLFELFNTLNDQDWETQTQFKGWTFNDVIAHLHFWNHAADLALQDGDAFGQFFQNFMASIKEWNGHLKFTHEWLNGIKNRELLYQWRDFYNSMAERFGNADPQQRVKWAGPDMSVRSSITARLMETWAHGQAVFDALGQTRYETDRIKNIAVMGVNTFGWSFTNRGLAVPADIPYIRLSAPSGTVWEWNPPSQVNFIEGEAVAFCQVVTQVRNVADTPLKVCGDTAVSWMAIAQCFAGPPEPPPVPGHRHRQ